MADKEDSLHIRVKIDVDEESKRFSDTVASNLARTDEQVAAGKQGKKGQQGFIGPPTHTRWQIEKTEKEIEEIKKKKKDEKKKDDKEVLKDLQLKKNSLLLQEIKEGPVGEMMKMSSNQINNLQQMVTNPPQFLLNALIKSLGRFGAAAARGGPFAIFALVIYMFVQFALDQLMQPGRMFDRRFRRVARDEVFNFYERQLQEELRQSMAEIRIGTMPGLRGGAGQVNGNLYQHASGVWGKIQSTPYRSSHEISQNGYVNGDPTDAGGSPRRKTVSERFG